MKTRVAAVANIAFLMARAGERVCLTSITQNAFDLDLLLWDEDDAKVGTSRAILGILDLIAEYQDTLLTSAWADADPATNDLEACDYGTMRLRRPSSVLQTLEPATEGNQPLDVLRGGPRRFSEEEPKEADDPRVDWPDFWANCAGAAFFEHIKGDLAKEHDWLLIDCDAVNDRELVLLLSASADVVLLLSDYGEGAKSEAYHLARDVRSVSEARPAILAFPASVRYDEMEILEKQRDHFDRYFAPFAPEGLERYWFVQAELPYVSYYMSRSLLLCRQHISRLHLPLYLAYQYVADTTRSVAAKYPCTSAGCGPRRAVRRRFAPRPMGCVHFLFHKEPGNCCSAPRVVAQERTASVPVSERFDPRDRNEEVARRHQLGAGTVRCACFVGNRGRVSVRVGTARTQGVREIRPAYPAVETR